MTKYLVLTLAMIGCFAQPVAASPLQEASGVHDFDFALGRFRTQIRRLEHPLSGSTTWLTYEGVKTDVPILGGAGGLEEIKADGAGHLEVITLRLYDVDARQWSLNFSPANTGVMAPPATGEFREGVGVFLSQEDYNGRTVLVRQMWSDITPDSYHFEQAFSADQGQTWEVNFIADLVRLDETPPKL